MTPINLISIGQLIELLRSEGLKVQRYQIHYGIETGQLPRPGMVGGSFLFTPGDIEAIRTYLAKPKKRETAKA